MEINSHLLLSLDFKYSLIYCYRSSLSEWVLESGRQMRKSNPKQQDDIRLILRLNKYRRDPCDVLLKNKQTLFLPG